MNAEENTPMEFEGKKYTKYEALQKQRRLETAMRAKRQDIHLLKEGGADEEDIIAARCRYRIISGEYTRFSEAMGLPQQRERVTVDGLGNIGVGKYKKTVEKPAARHAVRNTGKVLEYNPKANFEIHLNNQSQQALIGLTRASQKVADIGGLKRLECLSLVDLHTGEEVYFEIGNETSVGFSEYIKYVNEHRDSHLAFVHNHNTDGYFSETDMRTLLTTECIDMFVAVRIDGVKYIAEKAKAAPNLVVYDKLFADQIAELNLKHKNGIITAGQRAKMREEIIVDGLIENYTKGLVELDGRVGNGNT